MLPALPRVLQLQPAGFRGLLNFSRPCCYSNSLSSLAVRPSCLCNCRLITRIKRQTGCWEPRTKSSQRRVQCQTCGAIWAVNGVRVRWASLIVNDDDALRIPVSDTLRGPALGKGCGGFHTFLFSSMARGTALRRLTQPPPTETCSLGFSVYRTVNTHQPPLLLYVLTLTHCVY